MRALGYFRTSETTSSDNPESYRALSRAFDQFCVLQSHMSQGVFSDENSDRDHSGFDALLSHIRQTGLAYLIVIPSSDHLGSRLSAKVNRILELDELDCKVVCDNSEMPDPLQGAIRGLRSQGNDKRRSATLEGMKAKAAQGRALGNPPFGYRIGINGVFEIVPREAETVKFIFQMYLSENHGIRTIASELNRLRIRTRRGNRWSMVTIRDVLRNHSYMGTYQRFGLRIPGNHQPIIPTDQFRVAQDKMYARRPDRRRPNRDTFLLSGLARCGYCGQGMMSVTRSRLWSKKNGDRSRKDYRYYQCQTRINRGQCAYRTRRADIVEAEVVHMLSRHRFTSEETEEVNVITRDSEPLQQAFPEDDRRYLEWVQRASDGMVTLNQLRIALKSLESEQRERSVVDQWERQGSAGINAWRLQQWTDLKSRWNHLNSERQKQIVKDLVSSVKVFKSKIEISVQDRT